jgi:hypothetical protein
MVPLTFTNPRAPKNLTDAGQTTYVFFASHPFGLTVRPYRRLLGNPIYSSY